MSTTPSLDQVEVGDMDALSAALLAAGVRDEPIGGDDEGQSNRTTRNKPPHLHPLQPRPAQANGAPSGTEGDGRAAGILMKDGKTVIPYGVLEGERSGRRQAEQRARDLEQQLEQLKSQGATRAEQSEAVQGMFSPEELADLAEALPAVKKLHDNFLSLQTQLAEVKSQRPAAAPATSEDEEADRAAAEVHAALTATPLLQRLQARGGAMWQEATQIDAELRDDPAWDDKPMAERFAEVQKRIADAYGIPIPSPKADPNPPTGQRKAPIEQEHETLSGMNGRTPVAEHDEANALHATELRAKFDRMSVDQINDFLARSAAG